MKTSRAVLMFKFFKRKITRKGFTLIELLVVIAIISILASIVSAQLTSARAKANDAKRIGDIQAVITALDLFHDDHGRYPCVGDINSLDPHWLDFLVSGKYLSASPVDPINSEVFGSPFGGEWYVTYYYQYGSWKKNAGGPCGQIAEIDYDRQSPGTPCINGGFWIDDPQTATHCHIFMPTTLSCSNPHLAGNDLYGHPDCVALQDPTGGSP